MAGGYIRHADSSPSRLATAVIDDQGQTMRPQTETLLA